MPDTRVDLDVEFDRLYQLPLDQFVPARDELAARVRAEGRAATALRVHSVAKPTVSAWAVNQLFWHDRAAFDALAEAGTRLRAAQATALDGQDREVREAGLARDAALVAALDRTLELLREGGHALTPAMRLRIATNLDALGAYGGAPPGAAPGRLIEDLEPPVPDAGDGAPTEQPADDAPAPPPDHGPAKVVSFEEIARARREVADAERLASQRRAEAQQAKAALADAQQSVKTALAEVDRAKHSWQVAATRAADAEREVPEREHALERARQAAAEAEQELERTRAALDAVRQARRK